MNFNISLYSTALFSTWINVDELNLLIDAGDGLSAGLLQKSRKIKQVFITHPDRDHLNGLAQFVQLNSRPDYPKIYYPKDSKSFPYLRDFLAKFDPHVEGSQWWEIEDQQVVPIKKGFEIQALRNEHIPVSSGVHKSLSYKLYEVKHKLKAEFQELSGKEIQKLALEKGREAITDIEKINRISFSGDTPVDDYAKWDQSEILIHEATFLDDDPRDKESHKTHPHSTVKEVLAMVKEIKVDKLILGHFSTRYDQEMIDQTVLKYIKEFQIQIPVYLVYPGVIRRDILSGRAINE